MTVIELVGKASLIEMKELKLSFTVRNILVYTLLVASPII